MSTHSVRNGYLRVRHLHRIPVAVLCFSVLMTGLAAFTPATTAPTVWVAQDATAAMHCTTHTMSDANTPRAVTAATIPCPSGTITQLVPVAQSIAVAHHEAYVTTPDGPMAQALLHPAHPAVGIHPALVCPSKAFCSGGGGGGDAPCSQQTQWINAAGYNTAFEGWYSTWGTSDCRAFEVYSIGLKETWVRPAWWPFSWHVTWEYDNGNWLGNGTNLSQSSWTTRFPSYWVGPGGSSEGFHEWGGWSSDDFSVQFTPR